MEENEDETQDETTIKDDDKQQKQKKEIGGRKGPEPTRFGDWENKGKCVDF